MKAIIVIFLIMAIITALYLFFLISVNNKEIKSLLKEIKEINIELERLKIEKKWVEFE